MNSSIMLDMMAVLLDLHTHRKVESNQEITEVQLAKDYCDNMQDKEMKDYSGI